MKGKTSEPDEVDEQNAGFVLSEKAAQASQLNLSARLSKDGAQGGTSIDCLAFCIVISEPQREQGLNLLIDKLDSTLKSNTNAF